MENGRWVTMNGTHVFIKDGQSPMDAFVRQKAKKSKYDRSPVVQGADEVADYLYQETDRDTVNQSEIDDFIMNDILDDELTDYRDKVTPGEFKALYKELERRGYKINYDKEKPRKKPEKAQNPKIDTPTQESNEKEKKQRERGQLLSQIYEETDTYAYKEIQTGNYSNEELKEILETLKKFR